MMSPRKEYIARPPKKRPLALFNYSMDISPPVYEDDENMQPEDLSMKSRRVPPPTTPTPTPLVLPPSPTPLAPTRSPASPAPTYTPRRPADISALLGLVGGRISISANITNTSITNTNITNIATNDIASKSSGGGDYINNSSVSYNNSGNYSRSADNYSSNSYTSSSSSSSYTSSYTSSSNSLTSSNSINGYNNSTVNNSSSSPCSANFSTNSSSFMSSAGLRLISEVAAACGRPTVLRAPGGTPTAHTSPYAPPTPRDPLRNVLRERSVGVRSWHYHPYLPLGVYGLPSPLQVAHTPTSAHKDVTSPAARPRGGSVSPPGETGSSSSEGSPEGQQEPRGPRLACPDCGRRYATMAGLAKHRQFHCLKDAGRSFSCKHCDKVYTSLGALKMHIRTHTLPCKCHLCGKAFSRPWLLQGHIRTHTGEKPFQCPQCDRCFADRSNLRAHLQTHTDVKKYACRTCPKTFSRMSLLVKHEDHGCPGMRPPRPLVLAQTSPVSL
ncbi:zinc finger protein SNAI3-like [Cherax quadricarinatus]|uniref:zinc finger protein SNAI3-like n=1 Tax=Cherax quadricarinatus TaxID=27406 RepID=UPI002378C418|nr:zinc finger protein SNAI3-like [Cherax quadricarinatus]